MPDKPEASETCILCGQKMRGVPQGEDAPTAQLFMLVEQAKADAKVAEAVLWCEENADMVMFNEGVWTVMGVAPQDVLSANALPSAVAELRQRLEGKAPSYTEKGDRE